MAVRSDGALSLGVNGWNNETGVASNPNKILSDANVSYNNWSFFSVTYDGTQTSNNVQFYFGTNTLPATLDRIATLNKGTTADTIAPTLTIGNGASDLRSSPFYSNFHGLIDQVRIYGSTSDNSGVLSPDQIQSLQQAVSLTNVPGVVYDQWNNISGNSISSLTSDPRFPSSPSLTKLQTNFEGYENSADNYGARLSGWVKAPVTGSYTFWILADDAGELRVSTDANPANKRLIASVATYNSNDTSWSQYASQKSEPVELQENQYYYVEALMKEGNGGDFVRVGWQLPSGTLERPIPQARLVTTPPDAVPFYPSEYPVYEPGTYVKKASMGWQKATNNDHFSLKTGQTEVLTAKDGVLMVPTWLQFGGTFPNDPSLGDLRFRWNRPTQQDVGSLYLETQGSKWAMRVDAGSATATPPTNPDVVFNQAMDIQGPNVQDQYGKWNTLTNLHHYNGITFERTRTDALVSDSDVQTGNLNGNGLLLTRNASLTGYPVHDTSNISAGWISVSGVDESAPTLTRAIQMNQYGLTYVVSNNGVPQSRTTIDEGGVTAPAATISYVYADSVVAKKFVITPKWKVSTQIPDYVFEKGYPLRSLEATERFVRAKKHLPGLPSAKEMSTQGVDLTEMNMKLLKQVEELTLHLIAVDKELKALQADRHRGPQAAASQAQADGKGE